MLHTDDIFVLNYVNRNAFLLFVSLFVCYLFPSAEPNCRNETDGWYSLSQYQSDDLKTQTWGSPGAEVGHNTMSGSDWFNIGFIHFIVSRNLTK